MSAKPIRVRGARTHNLREVNVDVPTGQLVVFTGVSGSGKSSLAFDTIAAEAQRLLNQTYPAFVQSLMPSLPRPDVDEISGLNAAVLIAQDSATTNPRSTVGTVTDAWTLLRSVYATLGEPGVPSVRHLSPTDPEGMCPTCQGSAETIDVDPDAVLDPTRSLAEGALTFPNFAVGSLFWKVYARSGHFDLDLPVGRYSPAQREQLLHGSGPNVDTGSYPMAYEGVIDKIRRLYLSKPAEDLKPRIRDALATVSTRRPCTSCGGSGLGSAGRACLVGGLGITAAAALPVADLVSYLREACATGGAEQIAAVKRLVAVLEALDDVGLGYLSLSRRSATLSGGEAQRLRTVRHLGSALTGLTYVLDEPTGGLHREDVARTLAVLQRLRDEGNSVLVVEHHRDVIAAADHVIDLGPGAGVHGGTITFTGTYPDLLTSATTTAEHLNRPLPTRTGARPATGTLAVRGARRNNLTGLDVDIPTGVLTVITGVCGSGKTSLLDCIPPDAGTARLTQAPITGSRRSSLVTYTGLLDSIRRTFAAATGAPASLFSANSDGACATCRGLGTTEVEIPFQEPVSVTCVTCQGRRYTAEVLKLRVQGRRIADVLALTVEDAPAVLGAPQEQATLAALGDVGLGYLSIGQTLSTLSGGERQRLALALAIRGQATTLVLDEPTGGLHLRDVDLLVELFGRLVEQGRTVIAADHHLRLVAAADHVIDLGPGAGDDGGRVVASGAPGQIARHPGSATGRHLARALAGSADQHP